MNTRLELLILIRGKNECRPDIVQAPQQLFSPIIQVPIPVTGYQNLPQFVPRNAPDLVRDIRKSILGVKPDMDPVTLSTESSQTLFPQRERTPVNGSRNGYHPNNHGLLLGARHFCLMLTANPNFLNSLSIAWDSLTVAGLDPAITRR